MGLVTNLNLICSMNMLGLWRYEHHSMLLYKILIRSCISGHCGSQSRVLVEITYRAVKVPYGKLDPAVVGHKFMTLTSITPSVRTIGGRSRIVLLKSRYCMMGIPWITMVSLVLMVLIM